ELNDALPLAEKMGNKELIARIHNARGDASYYQGDFAAARRMYEQARAMAEREKLRPLAMIARLNIAKVAAREGRPSQVAELAALRNDAEQLGLRYESVEVALLAGESELGLRHYARARDQLETALENAERLGARSLAAQAHYFLGLAYGAEGSQA